ncbi:DUF3240 family protein [Methylomonas paludis]|uniref:DUF3240 family protein n=1 Tax=Methylomonas paludis TaxID=1173101 RepID=A0A975R9Z5_9GAMM|nr:DUF3240 family protein [Methylomonas paludis]QWF70701.1 DUF3240 family protein [Methylomonas paludis]
MTHEDYLLTIDVPPSLEETLVDCLLGLDNVLKFSSFSSNAHDHLLQDLSLVEQVTGRQRKISFQIHVDKSGVAELINRLKTEFSGSGLHYWVIPIIVHGKL